MLDINEKQMIKKIISKKDTHIRYYFYEKRMNLGEKRNICNDLVRDVCKYICCFDDDDYYPKNRVQKSVDALIS